MNLGLVATIFELMYCYGMDINKNDSETVCLAQVIHHEARGEGIAGQEAVAQVVINRTRSGKFRDSICKVVTQRSQFSGFNRGIRPNSISFGVAARVLAGKTTNLVGKSLYFNGFGPKRSIKVGNHRFW